MTPRGSRGAAFRARIELVLAVLLLLAAAGTAIHPDWIESVTGLDPDGGNGVVEWLLVAALAVAALAVAARGRRDLRAAQAAAPLR